MYYIGDSYFWLSLFIVMNIRWRGGGLRWTKEKKKWDREKERHEGSVDGNEWVWDYNKQ